MLQMLADSWWAFLLRGLSAIAFGVAAFVRPFATLSAMVLWFGAYALVDGMFSVAAAVLNRRADWVMLLLHGALGIIVGYLTFRSPELTAMALLFYVAAWMLVGGASKIGIAMLLRKEMQGEWILALGGALSIAGAFVLLWRPLAGALAMLWVIAGYAVAIGVLLVAFAVRIRGMRGSTVA